MDTALSSQRVTFSLLRDLPLLAMLSLLVASCSIGSPDVCWTDSDGFSVVRTEVKGQDVAITFRYDGACESASGDLRFLWQTDGRVVSDSELSGALVTRDLPVIEAGAERAVSYWMPYPAEDVEAVIVELVESGCGQIDPVG